MSHDRFQNAVLRAIESSDMSPSQIAGVLRIAPRTCDQRLRRLRSKLPIQIMDLLDLMDAVGYEINVKKREKNGD